MTLAESEKTPERSPESAQLDEAAIRRLQDDLPDDEVLYDLAELFRVFGDSTRIKILYALFESELCVNDIAQVVGISQSAVSHQLRLLKTSKLVKFRREGKAMYYSLDDDHVRIRSGEEGSLSWIQAEAFRGVFAQEPHKVGDGDAALGNPFVPRDAEKRIHAGRAVRGPEGFGKERLVGGGGVPRRVGSALCALTTK